MKQHVKQIILLSLTMLSSTLCAMEQEIVKRNVTLGNIRYWIPSEQGTDAHALLDLTTGIFFGSESYINSQGQQESRLHQSPRDLFVLLAEKYKEQEEQNAATKLIDLIPNDDTVLAFTSTIPGDSYSETVSFHMKTGSYSGYSTRTTKYGPWVQVLLNAKKTFKRLHAEYEEEHQKAKKHKDDN